MTDLKPCPFCGEQSEAASEAAEPLTCNGCTYRRISRHMKNATGAQGLTQTITAARQRERRTKHD